MPKTKIVQQSSEKIILDAKEPPKTAEWQTKALYHVVSGMAHEMHSPLNQTLELTKKLINKYRDREFEYISYREFQDIMDTLAHVHNQLQFCCETADQLMSLDSAQTRTSKKLSKVNVVLEEVVGLIRHRFETMGASIKYRLAKALPNVAMNPLDLEQIITNVANNAVQAMPTGGLLKIKTALIHDGKMVQIDFQDDGIGICKEHMDRIFDPFFTTKQRRSEKGAGLGLSIVYSILKANKGDILIESSLRKGTLVKILLPVAKLKHKKSN